MPGIHQDDASTAKFALAVDCFLQHSLPRRSARTDRSGVN